MDKHISIDAWQGARDLASLGGEESLFADAAREKLEQLRKELQPLAARYDVVVANPPYMGSSSLGSWMSSWVKKQYPDEKSDLCTSFIERGFTLSRDDGANAMITMQSWMFLGSYEKMRGKLLRNHSISSMAHLGTRAFGAIAGEVVSTTATVFGNALSDEPGAYFRLVDMAGENEKREGYLEALANSECGWFFRRTRESFDLIPNSPIAYWASPSLLKAFSNGNPLRAIGRTSKGIITGDNNSFLRLWWECGLCNTVFNGSSYEEAFETSNRWFACTKGGQFRKWAGNTEWVVDWRGNGEEVRKAAVRDGHHCQDYANELKFAESATWSAISSDVASFRYSDGMLSEHAGMCDFINHETIIYALAFLNSTIARDALALLAPTLNFNAGDIDSLPLMYDEAAYETIETLARKAISASLHDWNTSETAWNFTNHPLV